MYVMSCKISLPDTIGNVGAIRHPSTVRIETGWKFLTSHAEITLPRNVAWFDRYRVQEIFKRGTRVIIELGYDGILTREFEGYITQVSADIPIRIKCEDEMWKLKQMPVNYSSASVTLQKLLADICPGYSIDALEGVQLGAVRLTQTTVAAVLEKIQSEYGLYSYMKGLQLVCGKYYADDSDVKPVDINLERIPSNDLNYRDPGYAHLKIRGKGASIKGTKLEYEFGEGGGDVMVMEYKTAQVMAELMRRVKEDYDKARRGGFDGTITAFGWPRVQHGWKADLTSVIYPDRNGTYYIDAVTKTFGPDGYRQEISLGGKV